MPGETLLQIKRVSSQAQHLAALEATCDYASFVGDSSALALFPQALQHGQLLERRAKDRLNRFTTTSISASCFAFDLQPSESANLCQSLHYITDEALMEVFRQHLAKRRTRLRGPRNHLPPSFALHHPGHKHSQSLFTNH